MDSCVVRSDMVELVEAEESLNGSIKELIRGVI